MFTVAERWLPPWLSVAIAYSACGPTAGLIQSTLKGALVLSPSFTSLEKNSTLTTLPSGSEAVAFKGMFAGAIKVALLVGLVMAMTGDSFRLMTGTPSSSITNQMSELLGESW